MNKIDELEKQWMQNEPELDEENAFMSMYNNLVEDAKKYGLSADDIVYQFLRNVLEPVCDLKVVYTKGMLAIKFGFVETTIDVAVAEQEQITIDKNFKCVPISCLSEILVMARKRFVLLK